MYCQRPQIRYRVSRGPGDLTDWTEYTADMTAEEQNAYDRCVLLRLDPNDSEDLRDALDRAAAAIREAVADGDPGGGLFSESPFDCGWTLTAEYIDPAEETLLDGDDACDALNALFEESWNDCDYRDVREFISRCAPDYTGAGTLAGLAEQIAEELGIEGFSVK